MHQEPNYLTIESATQQGLTSITTPMTHGETWIICNILDDLRRGNIPCAAVVTPQGTEVWRATSGMKFNTIEPSTTHQITNP